MDQLSIFVQWLEKASNQQDGCTPQLFEQWVAGQKSIDQHTLYYLVGFLSDPNMDPKLRYIVGDLLAEAGFQDLVLKVLSDEEKLVLQSDPYFHRVERFFAWVSPRYDTGGDFSATRVTPIHEHTYYVAEMVAVPGFGYNRIVRRYERGRMVEVVCDPASFDRMIEFLKALHTACGESLRAASEG